MIDCVKDGGLCACQGEQLRRCNGLKKQNDIITGAKQGLRHMQAEAMVERLASSLRHMKWCADCAREGWDECEGGREALNALQAYEAWKK